MVGTLTQFCGDCAEVVGASAAGVMLADTSGPLEIMASSSHSARELDLYEIQADEGPCVEAVRTGASVSAASAAEIIERWPSFGGRAATAGFQAAAAAPLRWRGEVIGAMNLFFSAPGALGGERRQFMEAFADVATIAIMHAGQPPAGDLAAIAHRALAARAVIEQAKGVISVQNGIGMSASFDYLRALARERDVLLETLASGVVDSVAPPRA